MKTRITILALILVIAGAGAWRWYFGGIQPITCGGIAGFGCPADYECKYGGNYPDAGGICVKK